MGLGGSWTGSLQNLRLCGGQTSAFRGWGRVEVDFQLPGAGTRLEARLQPPGNGLVAFGSGTLTNMHTAGIIKR